MKNKKLRLVLGLELLHTFSKKELEELKAVANCSYFNTDKYVIALLESLMRHVLIQPRSEVVQFDEAMRCVVYREVFPNKKVPKNTLNPQEYSFLKAKMNALTRVAEQYLCHEVMKTDKAFKTKALYKKLLDRKQDYLLNRHIKRDRKLMQHTQARGVDYHDFRFEAESGVLNKIFRDGEFAAGDNLTGVNENLDLFYLLHKLRLHLSTLSVLNVFEGRTYDFSSVDALKDLLALNPYAEHPLIQIYQTAIELLVHNAPTMYEQFSNQLETYTSVIPRKDLRELYVMATNFCTEQIRMGKSEYYRPLFELYRKMDVENLLHEGNFIELRKLKNALGAARREKEYDWVLKALDKYHPMLKKTLQQGVYDYYCGLIAFDQADYGEVIYHLMRIDKINDVYDLNARTMLLKAYYEIDTDYEERTVRLLLQSEQFIKSRKKMVRKYKDAFKNFVRILINIYNTRHGAGKMTPEKIQRKLDKLEFVSDKKWLEEKIDNIH